MKPSSGPNNWLVWLSPVVGALAPTIFLSVRSMLDGATEIAGATIAFWVSRDLVIGYAATLPVLAVLRSLGARHPVSLWAIAALVGGPMGYVLAHPVEFAWTPTEEA